MFDEWQTEEKVSFTIEELTKGANGEISKTDRVNRLQPDIEGGGTAKHPRLKGHPKFYFPFVVYYEGMGLCSWKFNEETQQLDYTVIETALYTRDGAGKLKQTRTGEFELTVLQKQVIQQEQEWRVAKPIKQISEDKTVYDLTRAFFEELRFFPFRQGHDDLIYDMKTLAVPVPFENRTITQPEWR